jgi:hypothetical protein
MMLPVRDRDRCIRIRRCARGMADTGHYKGWRSIESALSLKDGPFARQALDSIFARFGLNVRCAIAMLGRPADAGR